MESQHQEQFRMKGVAFFEICFLSLVPFLAHGQIENPVGSGTPGARFLLQILDAIIFIAVPVIVVLVIYAGFSFVTASGNREKLAAAKKRLAWVLIVAFIVLGANTILNVFGGTGREIAPDGISGPPALPPPPPSQPSPAPPPPPSPPPSNPTPTPPPPPPPSSPTPTPPAPAPPPPPPSPVVSNTPNYVDPAASCSSLQSRNTVSVSNSTGLAQALSNAQCGDTIQLAAGAYASNQTIGKSCPIDNPIIIQGAPNFASQMTGRITLQGARNIITGVQFTGTNAKITMEGDNNKIIGNRFTGWTGNAISPTRGGSGEIAYNEFYDPAPWGPITSNTQFRMGIRGLEDGQSTVHRDVWIHHNHFHDFPNKPDPAQYHTGQSDAIEVCEWNASWTPTLNTGWYIEHNLFENHEQSGQAMVDAKCGGVVMRYNTINNSPAMRLDLRYGSESVIESNWIEHGGITVNGGNHRIVGNYIGGGPGITLLSGDQEWDFGGANGHPSAHNTLVAGNEASLLRVGRAYNTAMQAYPTSDTQIEEHTGNISYDFEQNTSESSNTTENFAPPVRLSSSSVGPNALANASPEYTACRE